MIFFWNPSQQHRQPKQPALLESAYATLWAASRGKTQSEINSSAAPHVRSFHRDYSNNAHQAKFCVRFCISPKLIKLLNFPWRQRNCTRGMWLDAAASHAALHWLWRWQRCGAMFRLVKMKTGFVLKSPHKCFQQFRVTAAAPVRSQLMTSSLQGASEEKKVLFWEL